MHIKDLWPLLLLLTIGCSTDKSDENSPNIILIMSDDQGWGDLSQNGNGNINTPNIDRIGREGINFDRFYVNPVCSPTRAALLTGRYAVRGGVYSTSSGGERLDLDEVTIADIFKEAGYSTAAYGKWHNGMQYPYHPNGRGFDDYYGFCSGHWGNYFNPMLEHNGQIVRGEGFLVDDLTDHGLNFIANNSEQPFFLYLPYNTPHSPMQVPDTFWNKFDNADLSHLYPDTSLENIQHTKAALAMCENIDWNVGRILDELERLDLEDNTIILYFSDNGPNGWRWNGGMKGRKGSTDEGGVRSPLVMRWPNKISGGKIFEGISSVMDLLPTLASMASIPLGRDRLLDGVDLWPYIHGDKEYPENRVIIHHWNNRMSVRTQEYLLDHEGKLFDMLSDPGQVQDVSSQYPDIVLSLNEEKTRWQDEVLSELSQEDLRRFPIGDSMYRYTQIPARDGETHGNIRRSNRWPNCSYFTDWRSTEDSITWPVKVRAAGQYKVDIYYSCPDSAIGSTINLSCNGSEIESQITEGHDPPVYGMENDRDPRGESYVKDFIPLEMGVMHLKEGSGTLTLKATQVPKGYVMDFRLMMFTRVE